MSKQRKIFVVGAGGHSKEVIEYIKSTSVQVIGCVDEKKNGTWEGIPLYSLTSFRAYLLRGVKMVGYLTAVGDNSARKKLVEKMAGFKNTAAVNVVHYRAFVGTSVEMGSGNLVSPGAILTASIRMGNHCIVNVKASVSHDCVIGDYVNINPNATLCGGVKVEDGVFIGAGATILPNVQIGKWATIGAGAVIIENVPEGATVVGVPGRVVSNKKKAVNE